MTVFHSVEINYIKHLPPLAFIITNPFTAPSTWVIRQCSHSPSLSLLPVWPLPTPTETPSPYEIACCLETTTRLSKECTGSTVIELALLRPDVFRTTTSKQRMRKTIYVRWMTGPWKTRAIGRNLQPKLHYLEACAQNYVQKNSY